MGGGGGGNERYLYPKTHTPHSHAPIRTCTRLSGNKPHSKTYLALIILDSQTKISVGEGGGGINDRQRRYKIYLNSDLTYSDSINMFLIRLFLWLGILEIIRDNQVELSYKYLDSNSRNSVLAW